MQFCVSLRDLSVSFGSRQILKGVNVDFPCRKVTVLLGRSGSGKTTLLRSINRLNESFDGYRGYGTGRVFLDGVLRPISGSGSLPLSILRRKVGMVFQSPNPLPLSIGKNILLPLALVAGKEGEEGKDAMKKALEEVGLWREVSDRLDRPASSLSGGQQQRLCLARALALTPEILLLDEPTSSLDRAAGRRIEELIFSLRERYSILMVSHSLSQAQRLGDYFAILTEGTLNGLLPASELPHGAEAETFIANLL